MRVNIEDDLFTSRRLAKFARVLGTDEPRALGLLVLFWRATQDQEIIAAPRGRLETIAAMELDAEPGKFVDALIAAQLAENEGGEITLKGNRQQVNRLRIFRQTATRGGQARAASAKRKPTGEFANSSMISQPTTSSEPAESSAPGSCLLSLSLRENTAREPDKPAGYRPADHNTRPMEPFVLAEARRLAIEHKRKDYPRNDTRDMQRAAGTIYLAYPDRWQSVLAQFFADEFYANVGHALTWLAKNVAQVAGRTSPKTKPSEPIADRIARQDAANKAALEEF